MLQIFQSFQNGKVALKQVPLPRAGAGRLLVQSEVSLISAGTERMLVNFGRSSLIAKVRSQPDKVRQVLAKMKTDGLWTTYKAVRRKLADPIPLGYSQVGRVIEVGSGVHGFKPGDRVVTNGSHAEYTTVHCHLAARIPDGVPSSDAAFTVVGAIALQGIRLLKPTLGERVAVLGLGLIGQLAVQLLLANGCQVLAMDLDASKVELAKTWGAQGLCLAGGVDPLPAALDFSANRGVDCVLITASTASAAPMEQAAAMCRQRGRIVLVGVVGLRLNRDQFYKKELSFQVSCSYGPGRYDSAYEDQGHDYPFGLVRWTVQRNFEAFLQLVAQGRIKTQELQSAEYLLEEAPKAYDELLSNPALLGVMLRYNQAPSKDRTLTLNHARIFAGSDQVPGIAVLGAGNYLKAVLLPLLDQCPKHRRVAIMSLQGANAALTGERFGFEKATTDLSTILTDPEVNSVILATRHDSHAGLVRDALEAGKHVFVEKPLATTWEGLEAVRGALEARPDLNLMVGFNRRYAPMSQEISRALRGRTAPLHVVCTINAGSLPEDHWTKDPTAGGGRILGEGCHFVDLMRHWVGSPIAGRRLLRACTGGREIEDHAVMTLAFEDGSLGSLHYFSNGNKGFPKEDYLLSWEGCQARLTNFTELRFWGGRGRNMRHRFSQDKGQRNALRAWFQGFQSIEARQDPQVLLEISACCLEDAPNRPEPAQADRG